MNKPTTKRLIILSDTEIKAYFGLPQFDDSERKHFLSLSLTEHQLMETLSGQTKWYFVLQLGYFKAKQQFFILRYRQDAIKQDLIFVNQQYQCPIPHKNLSEDTHRKIRRMILDYCNYQDNTQSCLTLLYQKASVLTRSTQTPKLIFESLYTTLLKSQFVIPQYSSFQKTITQALQQESLRLKNVLIKSMPRYAIRSIKKLLSTDKMYYDITLIKRDQKNFSHSEVKKAIQHLHDYGKLHTLSQKLIPKLSITQEMINHYARLAQYYPVAKLKQLNEYAVYLYILCYIAQRMKIINDNLMESFMYYVKQYEKAASEYAKQCVYTSKMNLNFNAKVQLPLLLQIILDDTISDEQIRPNSFALIPKDQFTDLIQYLQGQGLDEHAFKWAYYEIIKGEITTNIRPIFRTLNFSCDAEHGTLEAAIQFLKSAFATKKSLSTIAPVDFPIPFISQKQLAYICDCTNEKTNSVRVAAYEFCVYEQIYKYARKNEVTLKDSINHKSLFDDLVPHHHKKKIIKQLNNPRLITPFAKQLAEDQKQLDELYYHVNARIKNGDNQSIKFINKKGKRHMILKYNKKEDLANHAFFSKLPPVGIINVLNFCHVNTGFLDRFTHIKPYHAKKKRDNQLILAAVLANASHRGIDEFACSSDVDYKSLFNTQREFIRLETLKSSSNILSQATMRLPIFSGWDIGTDILHAAVDGQKFKTRHEILKARHSSKYFPQKKGVVAYSLLANFIPLAAEIISPNLHESYFLFDILKNLTTDIQLDRVSGDSHAINPANFFLTRYLPIEFAPHLIHINKKIANLSSITPLNEFRNLVIKPHHHIHTDTILSKEDDLNWIVASLLHGDVQQSIIVRKLSSLSRHHPTCKALAEYNRILESIYTLKYIDDPQLRQYVRGSLNRLEAYHQLRRAIAFAHGGEFRGSSEMELAIWNECARLVANAIIYYNACLLSALMEKYKKMGKHDIVETIMRISPLAWTHLCLFGRMEFFTEHPDIDIHKMVDGVDFF